MTASFSVEPTQAGVQQAPALRATGMHPRGIAAASSLLLGVPVYFSALPKDGLDG